MTDEGERQSEQQTLRKELIQAKQLMEEGIIEEANLIVLGLENKENLTDKELLLCKLLKAKFLYKSMNYSEAIIYTDELLQESQKGGDLLSSLDALLIHAISYRMLGKANKSEDLLKKAEDLFKKIKVTSIIDLRERESFLVRIVSNICTLNGEIHRSLELNKRAFELAKGCKDRELTSAPLINIAENYLILGDYDNAKLYAERAMEIQYQPFLISSLGLILDILLYKGDIEGANHYFQQISEIREKDKNKRNDNVYRYYKAVLLKTSLRSKNRVKSEELLKQILEDEDLDYDYVLKAFLSLCDLLLIELRITNYPEIIDELQPYIKKLLDFAEKSHSYVILCETYLLQAKLSLLSFNIKRAQRFLTQAQQIAERFGLTQLTGKITNEKEDLIKKLDLWEKLKESGAPMVDRIELARLDEQIKGIIQKSSVFSTQVTEEKVAISKETKICLVCRGEVFGFSYACKCGANYCENCARALINLENVCWACETPIDYSKPVKQFKEEEKRIEIQEKAKKK